MTEKRFQHKHNVLGMQFICYDDKDILLGTFANNDGVEHIVDKLNELYEKTEQLEKELYQQEVSEQRKKEYDVIDKEEPRGQSVTYKGIPCTARTCVTRLNRLAEENKQLKAQLLYDGEEVCNICKYQYFVESRRCYIGQCEKGNEEYSKGTVSYCKDFKLKELSE